MGKVGLPYHSPHKFRHGYTLYLNERAVTIADYKAESMSLLHSSMNITDGVYSLLGDKEIRDRISALGRDNPASAQNQGDTFTLFQEFLTWYENRNK